MSVSYFFANSESEVNCKLLHAVFGFIDEAKMAVSSAKVAIVEPGQIRCNRGSIIFL